MTRYTFRIADSFTPETIPMARLGEYMVEYARMLGEPGEVHFEHIVNKSVGLVAVVEEQSLSRVETRIRAIGGGNGPEDGMKAMKRLDDMLASDNAVGELLRDEVQIIPFPGKTRERPVSFGPFTQVGTIEGEVVRVGGQDDTIYVMLRDGDRIFSGCVTTREVGQRLGHHLLGPIIRAHGEGRWIRHADGEWEMKSFRIRDFDVLEETSLPEVVARLRAVKGNGWAEVDSPIDTILSERGQAIGGRPN